MENKYMVLAEPKNKKKKKEEHKECIICLENVNLNNHMFCKTCNNVYHKKCLNEWTKKSNSCVCTYCQQPTIKCHKEYFKLLRQCFQTMFR